MKRIVPLLALLASCRQAPPAKPIAAAPACATCHAAQARTHAQSGMGRAFARATPPTLSKEDFSRNTYFHAPSDRHYTMLRRGGEFFQRRHQVGFDGTETNAVEMRIDYVLGSGNHARTYLTRTADNRLLQLPLGWYSEEGGKWAMNPGYDRPDHQDFRREIGYACFFCHNAYPTVANASLDAAAVYPAELPAGVDCQRCHGEGNEHASSGGKAAILNPARLSPERQMEVCMQCHLETTSFALPHAVHRFGRRVFSYSPAEPLAAYAIHFDHSPGAGRGGKFEIVNAAYRLRQSACFRSGSMTCLTCHNPHQGGWKGDAVCRSCHASPAGPVHTGKTECASCHMPKRRTEDVIHAVMTDHLIQRKAPPGLTAPRAERVEEGATAYRGEVALYYPPSLSTADSDLYLAYAQVAQNANSRPGLARLAAAIEKHRPPGPEFYAGLGLALSAAGRTAEAETRLQQALDRDANYLPALRGLADTARQSGRQARAAELMKKILERRPNEAATWHELGRLERSPAAVRKAVALTPEFAEAWNTLGTLEGESGNIAEARRAWAEAIRHQPDLAEARVNLGNALAAEGRFPEARFEAEAAAKSKPGYAPAWELLGNLSAQRGEWPAAAAQFRKALAADPAYDRAHLGLGTALAAQRDLTGARSHLQRAASSRNPAVQAEAASLLRELPR